MTETVVVTKMYLRSMPFRRLDNFLKNNFNKLIGGQVFTVGKTFLTKTIQAITKKYAKGDFCPVHVGQIINIGSKLFVVNVMPPKVDYIELADYITNTDEDFRIIFRGNDFKLDTTRYSYEVSNLVGKNYGYFSAIQSGIKGISWIPNRKIHCSECCVKFLQNQGYFKGVKADDITPVEAFYKMINGDF